MSKIPRQNISCPEMPMIASLWPPAPDSIYWPIVKTSSWDTGYSSQLRAVIRMRRRKITNMLERKEDLIREMKVRIERFRVWFICDREKWREERIWSYFNSIEFSYPGRKRDYSILLFLKSRYNVIWRDQGKSFPLRSTRCAQEHDRWEKKPSHADRVSRLRTNIPSYRSV
jgi:hypothetical protein